MSIAIILATIFQCWPVDAVYNPQKYDHYTCFASIPFWYATAALSLVTDLWILGLPIRTILGAFINKGGLVREGRTAITHECRPTNWEHEACGSHRSVILGNVVRIPSERVVEHICLTGYHAAPALPALFEWCTSSSFMRAMIQAGAHSASPCRQESKLLLPSLQPACQAPSRSWI